MRHNTKLSKKVGNKKRSHVKVSRDPSFGFPDAFKNHRLPVVITVSSLYKKIVSFLLIKPETITTKWGECYEIKNRKGWEGRSDHSNIDFVGAGIGKERLGDPEDGVLGRRLHVAEPGSHGSSTDRRHHRRPKDPSPFQDLSADRGHGPLCSLLATYRTGEWRREEVRNRQAERRLSGGRMERRRSEKRGKRVG
ncbi:hypothetical protein BHE74_00022712 [Ensete ventricosum]|nr:hypothetical protein GW17_00011845 [Ensete ventricosum]RWW69679.1 hypothetical protein BHE74_00022712 [Ensete ventricosum]RZS09725.1 hypothetical protein BHM03_00040837 [Ensete ventricosum]